MSKEVSYNPEELTEKLKKIRDSFPTDSEDYEAVNTAISLVWVLTEEARYRLKPYE